MIVHDHIGYIFNPFVREIKGIYQDLKIGFPVNRQPFNYVAVMELFCRCNNFICLIPSAQSRSLMLLRSQAGLGNENMFPRSLVPAWRT